jgi:hypothetical protein
MDEREIDGGRRGLLTSALTSIDRRRTAAFLSLSELRAEQGPRKERLGYCSSKLHKPLYLYVTNQQDAL